MIFTLATLRFLSLQSLHKLRLDYLLTVLLRYNLYLCYLHCSTYTTYNVMMHTYLEAHHFHTHTHKKERLIHKKLTVTKDKKARKYTRLFVCRRYLFRERRLRKTLSLEKQTRYEHNFAPNGGYCVNCPSHNFCVF